MTIKNGKINPLNVLGLRRVDFPAYHFEYMTIPKYSPSLIAKIDSWLQQNLNGRYYIGQSLTLDANNVIVYTTKIGFENKKELSFFNLAFSNLN